jgi:hypothetical protein
VEKSIYQDLYEFETEQRSHLASTVNVPIVASTAIGSAAVTMALSYPYESSVRSSCFDLSLALTALSLGLAVFFVFRSLIGYEYERLPSALKLRAIYPAMRQAHLDIMGSNKEAEATATAKLEFADALEQRYSEAADVNRANNQNRSRFIYSANVTLAVGTVLLASASAFYLYARITMPKEVHQVRIVGEVQMSEQQTQKPPVQAPKPAERPAPVVIPPFPPNEKFRDYTRDIPATVVTPKR